ncbi:MAG: pyruvate kinase [Candidatus Nomurabacteria bacterium]|jgi:pyruvate kinase|nr:pyruvate kinase [Candidatus Nomurabacteria bacterium]
MARKTGIVSTIGPVLFTDGMMEQAIERGVDVCRFNFSHGKYEEFDALFARVLAMREKTGRDIKILQDLQGPKIRLGKIGGGQRLDIKTGDILTLDYALFEQGVESGEGELTLPIQYNLAEKVKVSETIFLFDGHVRTIVREIVSATAIKIEAQNDGWIVSNKGLNLPETDFGNDVFPEKDLKDVAWSVDKNMIDWVAISFIQSAENIRQFRQILAGHGITGRKIVAKIETRQAVKDDATLEEIVKETDIVMVARGDMGYEVGFEKVPVVQRKLIALCRKYGKQVIVATQTMSSMMEEPEPTRAEVSDVANACIQGADYVMTSDETTLGKYPLETVTAIDKVLEYTEENVEVTPDEELLRSVHLA